MIAREKALEVIDSAIKDYTGDTGPGRWVARFWHTGHGPFPALVYEYVTKRPLWAHDYKHVPKLKGLCKYPLPGEDWEDILDPWLRWGGAEIVEKIERKCQDIYLGDGDSEYFPLEKIYRAAALFFATEKYV